MNRDHRALLKLLTNLGDPEFVAAMPPDAVASLVEAFVGIVAAVNLIIRGTPAVLDSFTAEQLAVTIRFGEPAVKAFAMRRLNDLKGRAHVQ